MPETPPGADEAGADTGDFAPESGRCPTPKTRSPVPKDAETDAKKLRPPSPGHATPDSTAPQRAGAHALRAFFPRRTKNDGQNRGVARIFGNARLRPAKRRSLRRASAASPPSSAVFPPSSARLICRSPVAALQTAEPPAAAPRAPISGRRFSVPRPLFLPTEGRRTVPPPGQRSPPGKEPLPENSSGHSPGHEKSPRGVASGGMISAFIDVRTDRTHGPAQTPSRQDQAEASLLLCSTLSSRRKITSSAPLTSRQIQGLELTKPATR